MKYLLNYREVSLKLKSKKTPLKTKLKALVFVLIFISFIVLLLLPKTFFNEGQAMCVSVLLFDLECYACGMTRATQHFIHGDFKTAYEFNPLSFVVVPLLIIMVLYELNKFAQELKSVELN